jgi:hypothetical protein
MRSRTLRRRSERVVQKPRHQLEWRRGWCGKARRIVARDEASGRTDFAKIQPSDCASRFI